MSDEASTGWTSGSDPKAAGAKRLVLRPLRNEDEADAMRAHAELRQDGFAFLLEDYEPGQPWAPYVNRLEEVRRGVNLAPDRVPATFLVAEVDGELVGRASVRHQLNDFLARWGGHIGYAVRPQFRRRGYATQILRQSLAVAPSVGVVSALVTCDVDNLASAAVIERCGGRFEGLVEGSGEEAAKRRYWCSTT